MRLIVAMTGASGAIYGARFLEVLHAAYPEVESHLIVSRPGLRVLKYETKLDERDLHDLAHVVHKEGDIGAVTASGSAGIDAMVIIPCSMKTLAGVANGLSRNLIERAADVALKERRRLVVVPRETPMSLPQLKNLVLCAEAGAVVLPAMPAFYQHPRSLDDLADFMAGKVLSALEFEHELYSAWAG